MPSNLGLTYTSGCGPRHEARYGALNSASTNSLDKSGGSRKDLPITLRKMVLIEAVSEVRELVPFKSNRMKKRFLNYIGHLQPLDTIRAHAPLLGSASMVGPEGFEPPTKRL